MVITELEVMLENVAKLGEAIPQCGDQQELSSLNAQAHARVSSFRRRQMKKHEDTKGQPAVGGGESRQEVGGGES